MDRQRFKAFISLITFGTIIQHCSGNNREVLEFKKWPSNCQPFPPVPKQPDIENLKLDDILPAGVFQMNLQARKAKTGPLEATFIFGNLGSGKSMVTPLILADLKKLTVGSAKSNSFTNYENRFGPNNVKSVLSSLLPDYYEYDSGKAAVWDFAGFGGNHSPKADIAEKYFLKHAIKITKSARFIFTITHSSVMLEGDVRKLATYATRFLKDVRKFKDSVGLVVTQVEQVGDDILGEDEMLFAIRKYLKSYLEKEKKTVNEIKKNDHGANETSLLLQRIEFIEGLLQEEVNKRGIKMDRLYFMNIPGVCGAVAWNASTKSNGSLFGTLKYSPIVPEDFGSTLRLDTLREIEQVLWIEESKGIANYAMRSSHGIMKNVERILLGSQNEVNMVEMLNGFRDAVDHQLGLMNGSRRIPDSTSAKIDNSMDFLVSCASQRIKTIEFFQEALGGGYESLPLSTLWEPLELAHSKLNDMAEFYNFCHKVYHALGEYSHQVALTVLKKKDGEIQVNQANVLDFLARNIMSVPDQIRTIWGNSTEGLKKYLVEMVQKQIPDIKFELSPTIPFPDCVRVNAIGRNVMLSAVMEAYLNYEESNSCIRSISVVAVDKVYIDYQVDSDLVRQILQYMSVVAPVWEVVPTETSEIRTIQLNGENRTGGDGGFFFGVYHKIINSKALLIRTNGGGVGEEQYTGGDSGSIYLVNTGSKSTIEIEACPGSGKNYGEFTELVYKPVHGIDRFKSEFIRTTLFDCFSLQSEELFQKLGSYPESMANAYTPLSLVTELETVEKKYYAHFRNCPATMKRRLTSYYKVTLKLINEMLGEANPDDSFALTWIGAKILGRLINQGRLELPLNVSRTNSYFEAIEANLEGLNITEPNVAINSLSTYFKEGLDDKVKETQDIISRMVNPAIKSSTDGLAELNNQLLKTFEAFLQDAEDDKELEKDMEQQLWIGSSLEVILHGMTIIGYAMVVVGPMTESAVLELGGTIGSAILGHEQGSLPESLSALIPDESDDYFKGLLNSEARSSKDDQVIKKDIGIAKSLTFVPHLANTTVSFIKGIKSDEKQYEKLEISLKKFDKHAEHIEKMKSNFFREFVPVMDELIRNVSKESVKLNGTVHSGLSVRKFGITKILKTMRRHIRAWTTWMSDTQIKKADERENVPGIALLEKFQTSIDQFEHAVEVMLELYAHIEAYQERKELADFVANVSSLTTENLSKIEDINLRDALARVSDSIKSNLALEECKKANHAFKQWVFPFASLYLQDKKELIYTLLNRFTDVANSCKEEISRLRSNLTEANSLGDKSDQYLYHYNFTGDSLTTRPFYVWNNVKWQDAISRLFRGETIQLKADVDMFGDENEKFFRDMSAIKYNFISVFIQAHDKSLQDELDGKLDNFQMHMTHSGVSVYKVNGQHFTMRDMAQIYSYNFDKNGGPNGLNYKVEGLGSDILLSPYTWWTFSISDPKNIGFEALQQFSTKVDMRLEGKGSYLDEFKAPSEFLNDLNLSEHYDTYASDDEMFLGEFQAEIFPRRCGQTTSLHKQPSQSGFSNFDEPFAARIQKTIGNPASLQRCYQKQKCHNDKDDSTIDGEYRLVSDPDNDDHSNYMTALGLSEDAQANIRSIKQVDVIIQKLKNESYYVGTRINGSTEYAIETHGEEVESVWSDGRVVLYIITINPEERSALYVSKFNDFQANDKLVFCTWGFNVSQTAKDAVSLAIFKRL